MKTIPHIYSDLDKLKSALEVASQIIDSNKNLKDDKNYGKLLIKNGICQHGKEDTKKDGSEAIARNLVHFFTLIGFISDNLTLTETGKKLLRYNNKKNVHKLWHNSLISTELNEEGISNPYKILIKLILNNPGIQSYKLSLSLECKDNSESEFNRITKLLELSKTQLADKLNVTEFKINNSKAMLPTLGVHIGDFTRNNGKYYPTEKLKDKYSGKYMIDTEISDELQFYSLKREVNYKTIARIPKRKPSEDIFLNLSDWHRKIFSRTVEHQELVQEFTKILGNKNYKTYEGPYDCLAIKRNSKLLIEAKTIKFDLRDQRKQAETALGQIKGYWHFDIESSLKHDHVHLILLFDREPHSTILKFLVENQLIPVWMSNDKNFYAVQNGKKRPIKFGLLKS